MLIRILPLLLILFSGKTLAIEFPLEVIEYLDNAKVVAFINEADIDKSLPWKPFGGAPPLTLERAIDLMQQHATADLKLKNVSLVEIELKQIPHHENYWHYLVKMRADADAADKRRSYYFIILMNGKIISGIREPESIK